MTVVSPSQVSRPSWAEEDRPDPLPLSREFDPPTPYPVEALGPIGTGVVQKMHEIIQAPVALIGQSILAAMNQVAQPHANVIVDGRVSPLSEFFLTLGNPASANPLPMDGRWLACVPGNAS